MVNKASQSEKQSASGTIVGFDFQYYYFLWKVISLERGQKVGFEISDDVHVEVDSESQILFQLKHTIKTKKDGSAPNLTTSDHDLWKTLSNWALVITDTVAGRGETDKQLDFISRTEFVLATNKTNSKTNDFDTALSKFKSDEIDVEAVRAVLKEIASQSKSDDLKSYTDILIRLEKKVLDQFLRKIRFELGEDELIKKCHFAIESKMVPKDKVQNVFSNLDSAIREDNFYSMKAGTPVEISFDNFYKRYRKLFDSSRNGPLQVKKFSGVLPDNLEDQTFIRQLVEIGDLNASDLSEISMLTGLKLTTDDNLSTWKQQGDITSLDVEALKDDAKLAWENTRKKTYRDVNLSLDHNKAALQLLDEMRAYDMKLDGQDLGRGFSNGGLYSMSDEPEIGWRKDWEKYKK